MILVNSRVLPVVDEAGDLPPGWSKAPLSDVCAINPRKPPANALPPDAPVTFVPMPAVDADAGAVTAPEEQPFQAVRRGFTSFKDGDVIMAKITPCMENGKAAVARRLTNGIGFGSTEFHVMRPSESLLADYLYHFIRQSSFRKAAEERMTGSVGQKRVPASFLEGVPIPLPPVSEQQRIVAKIEELLASANAAYQRLARVPAILKRFRQSVLAAACSGRLTEDWRASTPLAATGMDLAAAIYAARANHAARTRPAVTGHWFPRMLGQADIAAAEDSPFPQAWASCPLSTVFWVETGATPLRSRSDYYQGGTVPWVKTGEVQNRDITAAEARITELALRETNVKVFPRGTILVAMYGEGKTRGQVGRLRIEAATNQACAALVNPWLNPVTADYAYLFCMSQYEAIRSEAMGGNQPNLSLGIIKQWRINLPPLAEQHEIVGRVEALFTLADTIEQRVAAATARADRVTQAILAKAFRGDLVPTDVELARRR